MRKKLLIISTVSLVGVFVAIRLVLAHHGQSSVSFEVNSSPLLAAIDHGDFAEFDRLIAAGLDPNTEVDGLSALHHAVRADNGRIVTRLLEAHVDANGLNRYRESPLIASIGNHPHAFDALLRGGADPNLTCGEFTPLTWLLNCHAASWQLRELLDSGADPNLIGVNKRTPLETAAWIGTPESIDILIEKGVQCGPKEGWRALYNAAIGVGINNIDCLLRHGVDPDAAGGPHNFTVFQTLVADSYRFKIASHLVDVGADPERPFPDGGTTMSIARGTNNWELIELLNKRAEKRAKAKGEPIK